LLLLLAIIFENKFLYLAVEFSGKQVWVCSHAAVMVLSLSLFGGHKKQEALLRCGSSGLVLVVKG